MIRDLPTILSRVRGGGGPQALLTPHSEEKLRDEGLGDAEVVLLSLGAGGTVATTLHGFPSKNSSRRSTFLAAFSAPRS